MATLLQKAISIPHFSCFTLATGWLPPGPSCVGTTGGWLRSHGHRLTLLFMAWACLTAGPEMENIAHLAGLLGAVMPQRPVLWQTINVPREKQRESDWLVLWRKVNPLPTPHWEMLWWILSGGREGRVGHFALLHTSPRYSHSDTRWRAPISCRAARGFYAVTELQSHCAPDLWHSTDRQMERRPCYMLPFTTFPLDTLQPRGINHFKGRPL